VPEWIEGLWFDALMADRVFDADHLYRNLHDRGADTVIPARRNRTIKIAHDEEACKRRRRPRIMPAKSKSSEA